MTSDQGDWVLRGTGPSQDRRAGPCLDRKRLNAWRQANARRRACRVGVDVIGPSIVKGHAGDRTEQSNRTVGDRRGG